MHGISSFIEAHVAVAWVVLLAAFAVLAKCADMFVESSVSLANRLRIPKIVIGIVLVSLATTAPELSVSLISALRGQPEMALGNAIGSVICNEGLGLALCAIFSVGSVAVIPHVLNTAGRFFLAVSVLCFAFVIFDGSLDRWEGLVLVILFAGYLWFLFREHRGGRYVDEVDLEAVGDHLQIPLPRVLGLCALALAGIILASNFIVTSATTIARSFQVPEAVIALTLVALGTSIPEVATCITAARKGHGELAVGNILGANIMNICWVAGASSIAHALVLSKKELFFMFPAMFVVVITTFVALRSDYKLTRRQGFVLLALYVMYILSFFVVFRPGGGGS